MDFAKFMHQEKALDNIVYSSPHLAAVHGRKRQLRERTGKVVYNRHYNFSSHHGSTLRKRKFFGTAIISPHLVRVLV